MAPIDLVSALVGDERQRRQDRLHERRHKFARFRDPIARSTPLNFDCNKKMNRALVYELATARIIGQREDVLFLGPPGTGKSHLAQAIGRAAIQQGYRVICREAHTLLEELTDAALEATRKEYLAELTLVPLLIVDKVHSDLQPAFAVSINGRLKCPPRPIKPKARDVQRHAAVPAMIHQHRTSQANPPRCARDSGGAHRCGRRGSSRANGLARRRTVSLAAADMFCRRRMTLAGHRIQKASKTAWCVSC
jgi:hypothetical protein